MKHHILTVLFLLSLLAEGLSQEWKVYNTGNSPLPDDRVNQIKQDKNGVFWICTNGGLATFDGTNWQTFTSFNSNIEDGTLTDIAIDGHYAWIGTSYSGVIKFDGTSFVTYDLDDIFGTYFQGTNSIQGIDVDQNHHVWIATSNGLVKYDGLNFTRYTTDNGLIGPNNRVWAVKCDTLQNTVWIGTFDAGLQKFENGNFSVYYPYDPLGPFGSYNQVNRIIFDQDGDIWVSGYGVFEFDKNTQALKTTYNSNNGLGDPLVWGIAFDKTGKLWVGSDCLEGVFCLDNGTWITYNETNSGFPQGTCYWVYNFAVDDDNNILMAHGDQGVIVYRKNGITLNNIDVESDHTFIMYPNPLIDNQLHINIKDRYEGLKIYNELGVVVLEQDIYGQKLLNLNLSHLNKGLYIIQVSVRNRSLQHKLIKN